MDTFAIRLKKAMEVKGLSQKELGKIVGISQQAIHQLTTGKIKHSGYIVPIAEVLGVDPAYLQFGSDQPDDAINKLPRGAIPILGWEQVSQWAIPGKPDIKFPSSPEYIIFQFPKPIRDLFALRIEGDSMVGEDMAFTPGSLIICDPNHLVYKPSEYVVGCVPDQKSAVFRQLIREGDKAFLKPLNVRYPIREWDITDSPFITFALVVAHINLFISL